MINNRFSHLEAAVVEIIKDKLYLGNEAGSSDQKLLEKHGITDILVAAKSLPRTFEKGGKYKYKVLEMLDLETENLFLHIKEACEFINQGGKVLVHCKAGVSRSASLVIAFLIIENKMTYDQALEFVRKKRRAVNPNSTFEIQLRELEKLIQQEDFHIMKLKDYIVKKESK